MFDQLIIGRYVRGQSLIHQLDPRTKIILCFLYIILVFVANHWLSYLILIAFTFLTIKLTGMELSIFLRGVRPMIWLILFTVIFQMLFTRGGTVFFQLGPISITSAGMINGIYIFIRLVLIILMSTVLTLTTSPIELTDGIEHLLRPLSRFGFPSHEIALMMSIALRYVPTLMDEATRIMNAQQSRGVEFDQGSLVDRAKSYVPILVPLFVSAFNRAEEMANAMEARGYQGGEGRSKYRQLSFDRIDYQAVMAFIFVAVVALAARQI